MKNDHELIDGYIAGCLSQEEFDELQRRLSENADTRSYLKLVTRLDLALHDRAQHHAASILMKTSASESPSKWWWFGLIVLIACASLAFGLVWSVPAVRPESTMEHYVATVHEASGVSWESELLVVGQRLPPGEIAITAGRVGIACDHGVLVYLVGSGRMQILESGLVTVHEGQVRVIHKTTTSNLVLRTAQSLFRAQGDHIDYALQVHGVEDRIDIKQGHVWRENLVESQGESLREIHERQSFVFNIQGEQANQWDATLFQEGEIRATVVVENPRAWQSFALTSIADLADPIQAKERGWRQEWSIIKDPEKRRTSTIVRPTGDGIGIIGDVGFTNRPDSFMPLNHKGITFIHVIYDNSMAQSVDYALALVLRAQGMRFGVSDHDGQSLHIDADIRRSLTVLPQAKRGRVHMLIKLVSSDSQPDQMLVSLFQDDEIPTMEPSQWQLYGPLFRSEMVLDKLSMRVISRREVLVHAIIVGDSFASVMKATP